MRHSIRTKITLLLTTVVVLTILITWFINSAFLIKYYMHIKEDKLYEAYNEVGQIFKNSSTSNLSEKDLDRIEKLETKFDVDVNVFNAQKEPVFPKSNDIGKRERSRAEDIAKSFAGFKNPNVTHSKVVKNEENYYIYTYYDKQLASSFINLSGLITISDTEDETSITGAATDITGKAEGQSKESDASSDSSSSADKSAANEKDTPGSTHSEAVTPVPDSEAGVSGNIHYGFPNSPSDDTDIKSNHSIDENDFIIDLRSNTGSITESARIANDFLAYVGIIAAVIGSIGVFLISEKFTKPIKELSGIAKKMTDLEFEVKYKTNSNDEIGELGKCINSLSDKLETTILELKQANNELLTDIQRKTEIDEMRKEFLSNVSHELKTPIALIQGYAEGLKENINEDEESRDFYCEVIMDEANKMNNMVKKLLSLNELEFGNSQVNFDRFDIVALIQSVINSTDILCKQKEVTLRFEQKEPVYVWADELLIEQVVTNYISNALNHVDGQKIIEIKLIPRQNIVRIAVFNTGNNIPEDELDKIWIKFYKVDKARTREYGGSGIGLSIVKAIMNSHNMECGAINRSVGVEFWFELDTKSDS